MLAYLAYLASGSKIANSCTSALLVVFVSNIGLEALAHRSSSEIGSLHEGGDQSTVSLFFFDGFASSQKERKKEGTNPFRPTFVPTHHYVFFFTQCISFLSSVVHK